MKYFNCFQNKIKFLSIWCLKNSLFKKTLGLKLQYECNFWSTYVRIIEWVNYDANTFGLNYISSESKSQN